MSFLRGFTAFGGRISHPMLVVVVLLLGLVMMWTSLATARTKPIEDYHKWWLYGTDSTPLGKVADEGDEPTPWMISWIGAGDFRIYTISNCGQSGYFEPPPDWKYYDGTFPYGFDYGNGYLGEFPAGSRQFYNWAAGIWVGAPYPKIIGSDTLWQPRVATGAYYTDMGAMSHLEQTNERIPTGLDGEGDYRFWQKGKPHQSYQEPWTHADTALNALRVAAGGEPLDPANGDYISLEDTWAVMGDWIPEDSASTVFIMGYDAFGLGVRLEQRTYSWNYAYNDRYIYLDYRIKNMNTFPLDSVYVGYFMDNDIGQAGYEDPEGSNDDLIGYNRVLNLGYTFDSNGSEPEWQYPAGYIGSVFCRTPRDIGMTGFQTWTREGQENMVDNTGRDDLKYAELACMPGDPPPNPPPNDTDPDHQFETFTVPRDVRQLMASGPFRLEARGDSLGRDQVTVGFAIVAGDDLEELEANAKMAIEQYKAGYMGPEAPPSPDLTVTPADGKVYLSWNDYPEATEDPLTTEKDFEGYRVYKNATGSPMDWNRLADYDVVGTETGDKVVIEKKAGPSSAQVEFEELDPKWESLFDVGHSYRIEFTSESDFEVRDYTIQHILPYNSKARSAEGVGGGEGFCVLGFRGDSIAAYPTFPGYSDSTRVYFDGMYLMIHNDTIPGAGQPSPMTEDLFAVTAYPSKAIGSQAGLRYSYVDDDVINGMTYYYSVTSYDRGDPSADLVSLEGGKTLEHSVVPGPLAENLEGGRITDILHIAGSGPEPDSAVIVDVVQPVQVTGHTYRVEFLAVDTLDRVGWRLRDVDLNQVLLDSMISIWGDTLENGESIPEKPVVDGLCLTISGLSDTTEEGTPFSTSDIYEFGTLKMTAKKADYSLDRIKVVPNPYIMRADWDRSRFDQWLNFIHLPSHCTIRIFTPSGLLIKTLRHSATGANSGVERWGLRTEEGLNCVSGLYLYQVESEDGKTKVGKFAIIR